MLCPISQRDESVGEYDSATHSICQLCTATIEIVGLEVRCGRC